MGRILDRIDEPAALRELDQQQLTQVAQEVRDTIISVITKRGGHLASNLGVVELTLAIHRVFDSPTDKIVWDTTNQCYTHKLVTGRRDQFDSIRTEAGRSGFGEPAESPHDILCAGHAGTGLSVGLGIAASHIITKKAAWTIAVVGDGAMTSGSSFEALNNIAHLKPEHLIVVLNDNGMSISDNVGFLTNWRTRITTHPEYQAMVARSKSMAKKVPTGELVYRLVKRLKGGLEGFTLPITMWSEMGFNYIGPIDGHDIEDIERALTQAKNFSGKPAFVHVLTHKGRGYAPAEEDPVKYHQPGSPLGAGTGAPTYSKIFAQTLSRIMTRDPNVVGISAAMLEGTGLKEVQEQFPERVFDVGIAEQHAVSMAAGMAKAGVKPFVSIYSTFLQRAFDQVVHDVCLQNLPVVLIVDRAGVVGEDGKTHHGAFDVSYLRCLPNAVVCAPKDENELQHLVYTGYLHNGPFAIRIPRGAALGVDLDPDLKPLEVGRGEVLREGKDVTIVALGKSVEYSLEAADLLDERGISCMVVNARFVKPIDEELLIRVTNATGRVVTVEENVLAGGFGSAVLEALTERNVKNFTPLRLGMPDAFVEHATAVMQRKILGLDGEGIARRILETFYPHLDIRSDEAPVAAGQAAGV
ncbi:MAG: 1-deoxy-D-xylulose-5-phosphate synthase [Chloroflexi bacterium]|nr:1-deoxy-D-xylulose-5-phosphate synthase [Chloroflexota bacterium]